MHILFLRGETVLDFEDSLALLFESITLGVTSPLPPVSDGVSVKIVLVEAEVHFLAELHAWTGVVAECADSAESEPVLT